MGRLVRRLGRGQRDHLVDHLLAERRDARRPRLVAQQAVDAFLGEALLPAPDAGLRLARPAHDLDGAEAVRRQQHDLGPPDMLLRAVAVTDDRLQAAAVAAVRATEIPGRMPQTRMAKPGRNPISDSTVRFDPLGAIKMLCESETTSYIVLGISGCLSEAMTMR